MPLKQCPIMIGVTGTVLDRDNIERLEKIRPASVIMFAHNYSNPEQMKKLIRDIKISAGNECMVAVDHEGGRVTRFPGGLPYFPSPRILADAGPESVYLHAKRAGEALKSWGFDLNLAPVVDVLSPLSHPRMIYRCFSNNPAIVSEMAGHYIRGMKDAGMKTVAKHFPGVAAAPLDPHETQPTVTLTAEEQEPYLEPFKHAVDAGVDGIMTSHILFSKIDPENPCTLSPIFIKTWIRKKLGFTGIIFSDDLEMGAIAERYSIQDAVRKALGAGCDIVLVCKDPQLQLAAANSV